jgi:thioredoxin-like negative regulator of GroEL
MVTEAAPSNRQRARRPTLLFFYSPRSGPCRRIEAFLAQVLQRRHNHDSFAIHRIDCEQQPDLAARLRIDSLPTLIVLEGKRSRSRLEQPEGRRAIENFLAPWLR